MDMTQTSKAGAPADRGFTLLELIAVVFVISLLLATVYPSFSRLGKGALIAEAKRTASVLRALNDTAVSKKETIELKFDFNKGALSWTSSKKERSETLRFLTHIKTPSTGAVSEGEVSFIFGPLGPADDLLVGLGAEGRAVTVTINRISGKVKIMAKE